MNEKLAYNQYFSMTQQEVSDAMGISRAMVNVIETDAKRKVKKMLAERGLTLDDLVGAMQ